MKKPVKVILSVLGGLLLLLLGAGVWLQTNTGQDWLTRQVLGYLHQKLPTRIEVAQIRFQWPDWIELRGVYIEDLQQDTLLAGQRLRIELDMWGLAQNRVYIKNIALDGVHLYLKRDTTFNFAFITEAFSSPDTSTDTSAAPWEIRLETIRAKALHLRYQDAWTGTDTDLHWGEASVAFSDFNLAQNRYHLASSSVVAAHTQVRMYEAHPPARPAESSMSPATDTLDLRLGKLHLKDYKLRYADERSGLSSVINIGTLDVESGPLGLGQMAVSLPKITLQNTDVQFQKEALRLDIARLNTVLEDFSFSPHQTKGRLKTANFVAQKGFVLRQFQTDFVYTPQQIVLKNLWLQTNETLLQNQVVVRVESWEKVAQNIGDVTLDVALKNSHVGFKDILTWVPSLKNTIPFDQNPNATLRLNGILKGKLSDLQLTDIDVGLLAQTRLRLEGRVQGLPNIGKAVLALKVKELTSSQSDLVRLLPPKTLPDSLTFPTVLTITGSATGRLDDLHLDTHLTSDLGEIAWVGTVQNFVKNKNQTVNGQLRLVDFDAGKVLQQSPEKLGKLSLDLHLQGSGIDPKTLVADWKGTIQKADWNGYVYQNLATTGRFAQQTLTLDAALNDPNAQLTLHANTDLRGEFPKIEATADIGHLYLQPLRLYADSMDIAGKIEARFASTDPQQPIGTLRIADATLTHRGRRIPLEKLWVQLLQQGDERTATVESPFLKAQASGLFDYTQLAEVVAQEVSRYFTLTQNAPRSLRSPHRFTVEGQISQHPILQAFVPTLTRLDTTRFVMTLNSQSDTTLLARLSSPLITYDSSSVKNLDFGIVGIDNEARYVGHIDQIESNGYNLKRAYLDGHIANNTLHFNLALKDSLFRQKHGIAGTLTADATDQYRLQFRDRGLLLDYKRWQSDSIGYVQLGRKGIRVQGFTLQQQEQQLAISSIDSTYNGPLKIKMKGLDLTSLSKLAPDSSLAIAGVLGGDIVLQNYTDSPIFTGDLAVQRLAYTNIPIGDIALKATNRNQNTITAEATLKSPDNDLTLRGNYLLKSENPLDFRLDIKKLSAKTLEAFSAGQLRQARGALSGQALLKGTFAQPQINGAAQFDSVAFRLTSLGAVYRIHNSRLQFEGTEVLLRKFMVNDTLNQPLQVDGKISIAQLPHVAYNLNVQGNNFRVLNASRKDNDFFYGQGIIDANIHVTGVSVQSVVDGTVKLKQGSDITVILPDDQAGQAATDGIVEFVAPHTNDNTPLTPNTPTETKAGQGGMEVSLNLEADDKSQLTIVVDERNGDNLKVRGNAQLNAGITPNGQPFMLGLYELSQGSYDLTFEVLKRAFTIQKGSRLIWSGDPMKADVNITAVYPVTTELTALKETAKTYGKMPLEVLLKMEGSLDNPTIGFDIRLSPNVPSDVKTKIENDGVFANIKGNTALMNKQVFSLLVLNKFMGEQTSDFFSSVNPEVIARQSVSKLLTDQLNMLASDLIKGVQLDFNLNSTTVATEKGNVGQTDLNVGLSKAFFNDRLTVNVGRNFEIEAGNRSKKSSEIIDNINVNYNLTRDGRYAFRAYRKNQYQAVLEGFIVETGVSFAVVMDYDQLREVFKK